MFYLISKNGKDYKVYSYWVGTAGNGEEIRKARRLPLRRVIYYADTKNPRIILNADDLFDWLRYDNGGEAIIREEIVEKYLKYIIG